MLDSRASASRSSKKEKKGQNRSYGFPSRRLTVCPTSRKFKIVAKGLGGTSATAIILSSAIARNYTVKSSDSIAVRAEVSN